MTNAIQHFATIYCEAESVPSGWDSGWANPSSEYGDSVLIKYGCTFDY